MEEKTKTYTEAEIREVLNMLTIPTEKEIRNARDVSKRYPGMGDVESLSDCESMQLAEQGAKTLVQVLLSGERDPEKVRDTLGADTGIVVCQQMLNRIKGR